MTLQRRINVDTRGNDTSLEARVSVNLAVGWCSLAAGAVTGLILGMWSFGGPVPIPEWIGEYDTLPRRFLRLGHIAFFGLGILNIMLARHLGRSRDFWLPRDIALSGMNLGNVFLPLTLIAAAGFEPVKYLMSLPAFAVTAALVVGAYVAVLDARGAER